MKRRFYLIILIMFIPLVVGEGIEDSPLLSGTEYNIRVDGDKTELNWILHLVNKGNRTMYGFGVNLIFSISEFHNNKNLSCEESFISDSMGQMRKYPLQKRKNQYIIPYSGQGGTLEPENAFNVINIMNCKGFVIKNEKGYTINWIFGKVPKTEDMVIVYEIKKPLLRNIKIVERFPPSTLVTKDANSVSIEWHTKEEYLSPTLTYRYEWDITTIILMAVSLILGVLLDRSIGLIRKRTKK